MGLIREPKGVDLIIGPSKDLTEEEKREISEIIANYKRTGKMPARRQRGSIRRKAGKAPGITKGLMKLKKEGRRR